MYLQRYMYTYIYIYVCVCVCVCVCIIYVLGQPNENGNVSLSLYITYKKRQGTKQPFHKGYYVGIHLYSSAYVAAPVQVIHYTAYMTIRGDMVRIAR
jgi:hypothetical protein